MDKIATWQGKTQTHGFSIDVFRDPVHGEFIAQIEPYSPPLWLGYTGQNPMMKFDSKEELSTARQK